MINEEFEDLFELDQKQKLAWNNLKKSFRACEKLKMYFYNNYGTLGVTDATKVNRYDDEDDGELDGDVNNPNEFQLPCNEWADDQHFFHESTQLTKRDRNMPRFGR